MSDDKSHRAPDTSATDLAAPREKLFSGARAVVERIDLADPDQVFDLAAALENADTRRLMQATFPELRAVCALAVRNSVIASHAHYLAELTDRGAPHADIAAARDALFLLVRGDVPAASDPVQSDKGGEHF